MSSPPPPQDASLVGCVLAEDVPIALRRARAASGLCDLVEFRLDAIADPVDVEALVRGAPRPAILTCRRVAEGGRFAGSEKRRLDLLRRGVAAGAAYVDLEPDVMGRLGDLGETRVIGSVHDPRGIPADLVAVLRGLRDAGADIVKAAVTARDLRDVARVLEVLEAEAERGPVSAHAMGEAGRISRLVAPRFGSVLTYAALAPGLEAAPGQAGLFEHRRVLRTHRIRRTTKIHAVLGADVSRSPSPAVMNAAFETLGLDRAYVPFSCADPVEALRSLPGDLFDGLSVTMPHKEAIRPGLDEIDVIAERAGAVNTVIRDEDGRRRGTNTDGPAILQALRAAGAPHPRGRTAVVVGAGGVARAAATVLGNEGAHVLVTGRTEGRARAVADAVGGRAVSEEDVPWAEVTIVVQATPLGARPTDPDPFDPARIRPDAVVLDVVAVPPVTRVLRALAARGVKVASGLDMFLAQAAGQVRLWTGRDAPEDAMREAADAHVERMSPVVLLGLRGAGKSTVGPRLAERMSRAFLDTDDLVARVTGRTPAEILREDGEAGFRVIEERAVAEALATTAAVVALGGGAVESERTRCLLAESTRVIRLDAADEVLLARTRDASFRPPLTARSPAEEIAALRSCRDPVFRDLASVSVSTDPPATPESTAAEIEEKLGGSAF